ncbi:macro domain-containing protein [candidate division KSB1 bacterium]|nr:macro domain-containing protein [candidate division KSB1 bacterium]
MKKYIKNTSIELIQGDITDLETDAIVNAANAQLVLGGGVAGAIRRKGGPKIQDECDAIGGTYVGGAVITTGGELKAKHVIHAVGPRMGEGNEREKLQNATWNSLAVASQHKLQSISFPAISTGIFGYPVEQCADIMVDTAIRFLSENETTIKRIIFCLWDDRTYQTFADKLDRATPGDR